MTATRVPRTVGVSGPPAGSATSVDFVPPDRRTRLRTRIALARVDFAGLTTAVCFFCLSLTPSLLPRPWYLQGVVSGVEQSNGATMITINGGQVDWAKVTTIKEAAAPKDVAQPESEKLNVFFREFCLAEAA